MVGNGDEMIEFSHPKYPPIKPIEIHPKGIEFCSSKSSKFSTFAPNSLHLFSCKLLTQSYFSPPKPEFPSKNPKSISNRHSNDQIFFTNSSTHLNFQPKNTHSVSSQTLRSSKFPSKRTKFRAKIKKSSSKQLNFLPKRTNFRSKINKISPATLQILTQIYKLGPSTDIITYTTFMKFLGDSGYVTEASELFALMKETHDPDVISFTVLIRIFCDSGKFDQALNLLREMTYYNCKPDIFCYNILLDKLGEAGHKELVWRLWWELQSDDICPDIVTYGSLVKMLCCANKINEALLALGLMEMSRTIEPNTYVYNTIIKAHLDRRQIEEALGVLGRMENRGCDPDLCSFNLFIKYFSDVGEGRKAYVFLKEMIGRGIEASASSYRICAFGLIKEGMVREVVELIEKIRSSCISLSICTWNKLILWLGKMGRLDEAYEAFRDLKNPDEITMNTVIHMFYKHRRGDKAWEVFNLMKEMRIEASVVTYNCLLDGLCKSGDVDEACELVLEMIKKGFRPDLVTYNTLINGLIGVGRTEDACKLFENMRGKLSSCTVPMEKIITQMVERKSIL